MDHKVGTVCTHNFSLLHVNMAVSWIGCEGILLLYECCSFLICWSEGTSDFMKVDPSIATCLRERERVIPARSFSSLESFSLLSLEGKQAILWRWIRPAFRFYKDFRASLAIMTPIPVILESPVLTTCSTRFKIRKLYVLFIQCFCFLWFSDQPVVILLYSH